MALIILDGTVGLEGTRARVSDAPGENFIDAPEAARPHPTSPSSPAARGPSSSRSDPMWSPGTQASQLRPAGAAHQGTLCYDIFLLRQ